MNLTVLASTVGPSCFWKIIDQKIWFSSITVFNFFQNAKMSLAPCFTAWESTSLGVLYSQLSGVLEVSILVLSTAKLETLYSIDLH